MVNPVDIGLRIAQVLDSIGIKMGSYIGKSSNVKKAMFGGKSTMFKPNAIQSLRGEGKNFEDALKLIEEENVVITLTHFGYIKTVLRSLKVKLIEDVLTAFFCCCFAL